MPDIVKELEEKKAKLDELIKHRSQANCAGKYSSSQDVQRETEIEELEETIDKLQKQLKIAK